MQDFFSRTLWHCDEEVGENGLTAKEQPNYIDLLFEEHDQLEREPIDVDPSPPQSFGKFEDLPEGIITEPNRDEETPEWPDEDTGLVDAWVLLSDDALEEHNDQEDPCDLDEDGSTDFDEEIDWEYLAELQKDSWNSEQVQEEVESDWRTDQAALRIMAECSTGSRRDQDRQLDRVISVLEMFPFASSHRAILQLAIEGASLNEIEEAAALRAYWFETPELWAVRRSSIGNVGMQVVLHPAARLAFSWPMAMSMTSKLDARSAYEKLCGPWLGQWQSLPMLIDGFGRLDPRYLNYISFLAGRRDDDLPDFEDPNAYYYEDAMDVLPKRQISVHAPSGEVVWSLTRHVIGEGDQPDSRFQEGVLK
ncbi:hypothetical protein K4L05_02280 [Phaeobacter inhibens]|uniref:hypothetical protein n=1 Tax=Phaeobacter inhibens TaxID=221822 RepID=UPI0021A49A9A|nr:hypothetical protein [Phaeobacter inhibens]UWR84924.1 hypothetical protein K4L05_02280 [Phaeobacter inhibens]